MLKSVFVKKRALMQKREFGYRQLKFIVVWMLVLGTPFILFVPDLLSRIEGVAYYIVNTLIMIVLVFVLWMSFREYRERVITGKKTG